MSFNSSMNSDVVKRGIDGVVVPGRKRRTLLSRMKRHKQGSGERMKLFKKSLVRKKVFRVKYTNKLKGSFGETDLEKGVIKINRKKHKNNGYPEMLDTKTHEFNHVKHPNMSEKNIRKLTQKQIKRMGKKTKGRIYKQKTIKI